MKLEWILLEFSTWNEPSWNLKEIKCTKTPEPGHRFFDGKLKRRMIEKTENWKDRTRKYRKWKMPKIEKTEKMNLDVEHDYRIQIFVIFFSLMFFP